VLVNPKHLVTEMTADRQFRPTSHESEQVKIRDSLSALCKLRVSTSDKLEIRVIDYPLAHGAIIVDPLTATGLVYVWHYGYKTERALVPKYFLRTFDGYWYKLFVEESEAVWWDAVVWECESNI